MPMRDLTLREFCAQTASKAPTPGGGSVSALTGALAAALAEMVASLTVAKAGFEAVQDEMCDLLSEGETLRDAFFSLIDADCAAFGSYMDALAMPKTAEEERAARRIALQEAARRSAEAPLEMARCAMQVMPLAEKALAHGNKMAASDARISAILARAAVRAAVTNVRVNLPSLGDEALAAEMERECAELEAKAAQRETEILAL